MKAALLFSVVGAALMAAAGAVLAHFYTGAGERRAIVLSALVAFVVQLVAFAMLRLAAKEHIIAAWGLAALLRFLVFGVWALVLVKSLGIPAGAAMVSMAVFLFASTLVEPLFLKT